MIFYFSGTGNSKYCADILKNKLSDELVNTADFIYKDKTDFNSSKPLIFICPTYAWKMPKLFYNFISKNNFPVNSDAYFIMTCGGETGAAQTEIIQLCKSKNLKFKGLLPVVMPDNYIIMFKSPTKEEINKLMKSTKLCIEQACQTIISQKSFPMLQIKTADKIKSGIVNNSMYKFFIKPKKFYTKSSCTGCGKCEAVCPLKNIKLENSKPVWSNNCTHCMACISYCPVSAIEYGKSTISKDRYICKQTIE